MDNFRKYVHQVLPLKQEEFEAVERVCIVRQEVRKTHLFKNGEICRHVYFIEKGFVRVFYYADGRDITSWFAKEGQIASATDSLFSGQASDYNIQLVEDSTLICVDYSKLELLFDKYPMVERLARLMTIDTYLKTEDRIKKMLFLTPEERYISLLESFPDIILRVPLGYIASYLGITQETLSRIRARINQ
jgi:CRP/FNR family transcriptional regulator, anaerobic regulatory protein